MPSTTINMLKISIKNEQGVETNAGLFPDEASLEAWYQEHFDLFPVPHTRHVTSLAEQVLDRQRDIESHEAIELGTILIKKIRKINRRKLKLGLWTQEQFNALLASPVAAGVERALWNGSLVTARYLMLQLSAFYSDLEIGEFTAAIDAHELKWAELI